MNIKGVFLCLVDILAFSISAVNENETDSVNKMFDQCPNVSRIIRDNKIEKYIIDCKTSGVNSEKLTEDKVLQNTCLIVLNMLHYICNGGLDISSEILNLDDKNISCPINLPQFANTKVIENIEKYLTDPRHCKQVCFDLDEPNKECIILYKINNFLRNNSANKDFQDDIEANKAEPEIPKTSIKKTETNIEKNHKVAEEKLDSNKQIMEENQNMKEDTSNLSKTEKTISTQGIAINEGLNNNNIINNNDLSEVDAKTERKSEKTNVKKPDDNIKVPGSELDPMKTDDSQKQYPLTKDYENTIQSFTGSKDLLNSDVHYSGNGFFQAEESHFFFYFLMLSSVIIIGYLAFHNKNKILAYALEGRNSRRSRRRPNSARYRKLESNLEEAIASNTTHSAASNVVY